VVGIATAKVAGGEAIGFAVAADHVRELVEADKGGLPRKRVRGARPPGAASRCGSKGSCRKSSLPPQGRAPRLLSARARPY
jgi:hypothetical protein